VISEIHRRLSIEELKSIVKPIAEEYGVEKVYLFGSVAKGTHGEESDYDFCIEKGRVRDFFEFSAFYTDVEEAIGAKVDIITTRIKNTEFLDRIKEDWVLVYGE